MADPPASAASLVGRTLKGKWRLESQLGTGGMASVWAARHRNGKRVAIKLLHPELCRDEHVRRRFLREGYVANKVKHPSVVTILDDEDDGELVFLVMELLEGETLSERWKKNDRRLGLRFVLRVADEVLDVLSAAHDQGIVHRDIKPANLFITTADELKVLDFGIARLHEGPAGTGHTTRLGATLGSPSFMSPEQARARWEFVDARTDLWAVGAVMFSLLSGKNVHEGKSSSEVLIATATQTARSLRSVWPDVPDVVSAIVDRALAFERTDRWQDARAMQAAVQRALQIDFEKPRGPMTSLADASLVVAASPAVTKHDRTPEPGPAIEEAEPAPPGQTQATGLLPTLKLSSRPPPGESTTSTPVAAPLEPAVPTLPSPPRPSMGLATVLGAFIAGGLVVGGVAFGLLSRRAAVPVVASPAPVEARPEVPPAATATATATAMASVEVPVESAAPVPAESAAPAASASAPAPKKKPGGPRRRPPGQGGRFNPRGI